MTAEEPVKESASSRAASYAGLADYCNEKQYTDVESSGETDALYCVASAVYELALQQSRANELLARIAAALEVAKNA